MRILITGISGFVGNCFYHELLNNYLKDGDEVYFLTHKRSFDLGIESLNKNVKLEIINGDIANLKSVDKFFYGIDLVVHMAAMVEYGGFNKSDYFRVNVMGTQNILKLSYDNNVKKVIYLSTAAIYHPMYDNYIGENIFGNNRCITNYTESKLRAYQEVKKYREKGLNIISILPSSVFGYGAPLFEPLILFCMKFRFMILPKYRGRLSIVSVDGLSSFISFCMFDDSKNKDYFLSDLDISLKSFIKKIEEIFKKRIVVILIPNFIMRWFMLFLELFRRFLKLKIFFNFELFRFIDGNFLVEDNRKNINNFSKLTKVSSYYDFHKDMEFIINKYVELKSCKK